MEAPKHVEVFRNEKWYCLACGNILMGIPKGLPRLIWCVNSNCTRFHWALARPDIVSTEVVAIVKEE